MKKDINKSKRRVPRDTSRTSEAKTTVSGSSGLAQLDAARLGYVATLPMGRPLLSALEEANGNYDARGLSRPTVVLQDVALNYYGMFFQPEDHPWLTRVATRIMAKLRAEVRSNTNYTEDDVRIYLIQAMTIYTHAVVIKRMLQTSTFYDVRAPFANIALNSAYGNIAVDPILGTIPTIATQANIPGASNTITMPTWLQPFNIGNSWLSSTKLEGTVAMYSLPTEIKALIDYYFGQIHVKESDSQYYAIRIVPESSGYIEYRNGNFVWNSEEDTSPACKEGYASVPYGWEINAAQFFTGSPVRMATLVADLRRLNGWEPCFIDMPPELGGAPVVNADSKYFATMGNAYHLEADVVNTSYNFSGAQSDYAAPCIREEVRINMYDFNFNDPIAVGIALLMCDVQTSAGERSHTLWTVRSETMYSETEAGQGSYLSMTQLPLLGCGFLVPQNGHYEFPIIGAGGNGPAKVSWEAIAALQADTLCPRVSLVFTGPTDGTSDRPFRSVVENGADLSNGTRVSFDNVNDVIETFYETLFVK